MPSYPDIELFKRPIRGLKVPTEVRMGIPLENHEIRDLSSWCAYEQAIIELKILQAFGVSSHVLAGDVFDTYKPRAPDDCPKP